MNEELRDKLVSTCRDTAKSLDMAQSGSRWLCEVTRVTISSRGSKKYQFYILDRNSRYEYEAEASIDNDENAEWSVSQVQ